MAKLIVHQGEDEGETYTFEPPIKFGRDEDNDLTVSDPRVSRIHGRVSRDGDAYYIEDLGSSNGTHVNGISTSRSQIVPGDLIQIGDTELVFELDEQETDQGLEASEASQQDLLEDEAMPENEGEESEVNLSWLVNTLKWLGGVILIAGIAYLSYFLVSMIL